MPGHAAALSVALEAPVVDAGTRVGGAQRREAFVVFDLFTDGNLERVVRGENLGTVVSSGR